MLDVRGVSRGRGGRNVLSGATFSVSPGRPTVILAPSPATRAGLLRMMAGLDSPDAGSIRFKGEDANRSRMLRRNTVWVRKFGCAATSAKVRSVLVSAARDAGLKGREADEAAVRAADSAGLRADLDTPVKRLDVERCIRVALAQATARKPVMLVLDDILSGLEGQARGRLLADLATMLSDTGEVMVVYATGLPDEARIIGGAIIVIEEGRVVQAGSTDDVLDHPADLVSAQATTRPRLNTLVVMKGDTGRRLADGTGFSAPPGWTCPRARAAPWPSARRTPAPIARGRGASVSWCAASAARPWATSASPASPSPTRPGWSACRPRAIRRRG